MELNDDINLYLPTQAFNEKDNYLEDEESPYTLIATIDGQEKSYRLKYGPNVIGRTHECHIQFNKRQLSRNHAIIEVCDDEVFIKDLGTMNCTFRKNKKLRQNVMYELVQGVNINFGGVVSAVMNCDVDANKTNRYENTVGQDEIIEESCHETSQELYKKLNAPVKTYEKVVDFQNNKHTQSESENNSLSPNFSKTIPKMASTPIIKKQTYTKIQLEKSENSKLKNLKHSSSSEEDLNFSNEKCNSQDLFSSFNSENSSHKSIQSENLNNNSLDINKKALVDDTVILDSKNASIINSNDQSNKNVTTESKVNIVFDTEVGSENQLGYIEVIDKNVRFSDQIVNINEVESEKMKSISIDEDNNVTQSVNMNTDENNKCTQIIEFKNISNSSSDDNIPATQVIQNINTEEYENEKICGTQIVEVKIKNPKLKLNKLDLDDTQAIGPLNESKKSDYLVTEEKINDNIQIANEETEKDIISPENQPDNEIENFSEISDTKVREKENKMQKKTTKKEKISQKKEKISQKKEKTSQKKGKIPQKKEKNSQKKGKNIQKEEMALNEVKKSQDMPIDIDDDDDDDDFIQEPIKNIRTLRSQAIQESTTKSNNRKRKENPVETKSEVIKKQKTEEKNEMEIFSNINPVKRKSKVQLETVYELNNNNKECTYRRSSQRLARAQKNDMKKSKAGRKVKTEKNENDDNSSVGFNDSLRYKDPKEKVFLFTGVVLTDRYKRIINRLGGRVTENPKEASHLITDRVRRTTKFMCCIAQGLPIVTPDWLEASGRFSHFIGTSSYLVDRTRSSRSINNGTNCNVNISESICAAQHYQQSSGGIMAHFKLIVFITDRAEPSTELIRTLVQYCGGVCLELTDPSFMDHLRDQDSNKICVAHPDDLKDQKLCTKYIKELNDFHVPLVTGEFILSMVMHQTWPIDSQYQLSQ